MSKRSFAEVLATLRDADLEALPGLDIGVLRNVTVEPVEAYLRYGAYRAGLNARVHFGQYDSVLSEALNPHAEIWSAAPRVVLVFARLETLSPPLAFRFPTLTREAIANEVAEIERFIDGTLHGLVQRPPELILWCGFETPLHPALGIYDSQTDLGQLGIVRQLNDKLRRVLAGLRNAYFIDMDLCVARVGADLFYDHRYWHIARAPYSREALSAIAAECLKFIRASIGKTKKCLALDCDNVLWGGVVGEDGLSGIQLSQEAPGSAFYEFQQEVLSLQQRGVILALCSKNNASDVWQVFREHPEMVLREEHIAAHRINWNDKASNLAEIAEELNIGLDSIVFADDSEFEVGLVRKSLPEVEVIHLPPRESASSRRVLAACGWFDTLVVSDEDRRRGEMYRAEAQRRSARSSHTDLAGYLKSLEMEAEIARVDATSTPRVSQLTQRTNQFNLTTRRYSEHDIAALAAEGDCDVLSLRLRDRFGDHGLVGAAILRHTNRTTEIDSFLLSCRVIGRGVEDVFLRACLALARERGSTAATGWFLPTAKNALVSEFYPRLGFELQEQKGDSILYGIDLNTELPERPTFLKSVRVISQESRN